MDVEILRVTIGRFYSFDEIPDNPTEINIWLLEPDMYLWFTTYDNRWRFLRESGRTMRSVISFGTKKEVEEFYNNNKIEEWTTTPLDEE